MPNRPQIEIFGFNITCKRTLSEKGTELIRFWCDLDPILKDIGGLTQNVPYTIFYEGMDGVDYWMRVGRIFVLLKNIFSFFSIDKGCRKGCHTLIIHIQCKLVTPAKEAHL